MMNADSAGRSRERLTRRYFLLLGGAFFSGMLFSSAIRNETTLPVVRSDAPVVVVATSVATLQESQEHSLLKGANSSLRVASANKELESPPEVRNSKSEDKQPHPANDNHTLTDSKASSPQGAANDNHTLTNSKASSPQGAANDNHTLTDSKASSPQGAANDNHTLTDSKASSPQGAANDNHTLTDSKASSPQGAANDNHTLTDSKASSPQGAANDNHTLTDSKASSPQGFTGRRPKLADGCWGVYLDVGSNIGVQVRKLFEPEHYPKARTNKYFDRIFGTADERRTPGRVCAIGFEANPVHVPRLQGLEKCYNSQGWRVHFVAPRAVLNDDNQTVEFVLDADAKNKNWGASMVFGANKGTTHVVQTIHLGKFIMDEVAGRLMPENSTSVGPVYAKFDIEGAEYQTFGGLITTGAVCEITEASIEFHDRYFNTSSAYLQAKKVYMDFFNLPKTFTSCNIMKIDNMDDEKYRQDRNTPVPDGCEKF